MKVGEGKRLLSDGRQGGVNGNLLVAVRGRTGDGVSGEMMLPPIDPLRWMTGLEKTTVLRGPNSANGSIRAIGTLERIHGDLVNVEIDKKNSHLRFHITYTWITSHVYNNYITFRYTHLFIFTYFINCSLSFTHSAACADVS